MIVVEGWVRVEDADEIDRLRSAAIEMMRATKAEEPGCLEYAYAIDVGDKTLLRIIERWTDEAALSAHLETPHAAVFASSAKPSQTRKSPRRWSKSILARSLAR